MVYKPLKSAQAWITKFTCNKHHACLLPRKRSSDGASTDWGGEHLIAAHCSFIDPKRMNGWVGIVGLIYTCTCTCIYMLVMRISGRLLMTFCTVFVVNCKVMSVYAFSLVISFVFSFHSMFFLTIFFVMSRAAWFTMNEDDINSVQQRTYDSGKAAHIVFVAARLAESACPLRDVAAIAWGDWSASVPQSQLPFPLSWSRSPSGCCRGFPSYTIAWSARSSARKYRISSRRTISWPATKYTRPCNSRRRPRDTTFLIGMTCICKYVTYYF